MSFGLQVIVQHNTQTRTESFTASHSHTRQTGTTNKVVSKKITMRYTFQILKNAF